MPSREPLGEGGCDNDLTLLGCGGVDNLKSYTYPPYVHKLKTFQIHSLHSLHCVGGQGAQTVAIS